MSFRRLDRAVRTRQVELVRQTLWTAYLAAVVAGERPLRAVRHPLGFICLPVLRDADEGVCVHLWPVGAEAKISPSNVHCHSWHLLSFVLEGTVHNQHFDLSETSDGPWRVYVVHTSDGVDEIVATDRLVDVKEHEPMSYHAGEFYEIEAGRFHASPLRGSGGAITVVLGRQCSDVDNLTLGHPDARTRPSRRERMSVEETRDIVRRLVAEMTA